MRVFWVFAAAVCMAGCDGVGDGQSDARDTAAPKFTGPITPVVEGGAYAPDENGRLWFLKGETAKLVQPGEVAPGKPAGSKAQAEFYFVQLQREKQELDALKAEIEEPIDPGDADSGP